MNIALQTKVVQISPIWPKCPFGEISFKQFKHFQSTPIPLNAEWSNSANEGSICEKRFNVSCSPTMNKLVVRFSKLHVPYPI